MPRTDILRETHPFVAAITKSGPQARVRAIRGYVGEQRDRGSVRIYLDLELRYFMDVPLDAVVHSERIPESALPLGGVVVWVRDNVKIGHGGTLALPEDPTTMAGGEEGSPPTTMATGEEGGGWINPFDAVGNPFSKF